MKQVPPNTALPEGTQFGNDISGRRSDTVASDARTATMIAQIHFGDIADFLFVAFTFPRLTQHQNQMLFVQRHELPATATTLDL